MYDSCRTGTYTRTSRGDTLPDGKTNDYYVQNKSEGAYAYIRFVYYSTCIHDVHGTIQVNARTHTCVACGLFVNTLYKPQNPSTMLYDGNAASALKTGRCTDRRTWSRGQSEDGASSLTTACTRVIRAVSPTGRTEEEKHAAVEIASLRYTVPTIVCADMIEPASAPRRYPVHHRYYVRRYPGTSTYFCVYLACVRREKKTCAHAALSALSGCHLRAPLFRRSKLLSPTGMMIR